MNIGCPLAREDAHLLFVPRTHEARDVQVWLKDYLGHLPDWEEVCSGGVGIPNVAAYYLKTMNVPDSDPFYKQYHEAPDQRRGEIVTRFALEGHQAARQAAQMSFASLGSWLGGMAVAHQARRVDISPGILAHADMRQFCLEETDFLDAFVDQGRPMFSQAAAACTVRVATRNPEHEGAVERSAELLHRRG